MNTHTHTHTNILRESVLSLGAAKSCQETLYPSLSLGREHFTYDIWRKTVLLEGGWCWCRYQRCVRAYQGVCIVLKGMYVLMADCIKVYCVVRVFVNWESTVFTECEAKHAARCEVFDAAGVRKRIRGMRVPHGELTLPDCQGEGWQGWLQGGWHLSKITNGHCAVSMLWGV